MIKIKKVFSAFAAVTLSAAMLAGCGNDSNTGEESTSSGIAVTANAMNIVSLEGGKATIPDVKTASFEIPENEALSFVKKMKIGWNLGNTLDAVADPAPADDLSLESAWCGVKTTEELILNIKNGGFNTVRVPVSWHNHVDGNYKINEPFLNRVQEVVDYVIKNDMYCILNIHHDNEKGYFYPDSENIDGSLKYIESIWAQLSERFKDYDEKLIFEGMNEPRLKGTSLEWYVDKNNSQSMDSVDCINRLTQKFVDTVRASGGKNADRYLMIPGYCASADGVMLDEFKLPEDKADNKLIVSVHAYTPYNFALQDDTGTSEWSMSKSSDTSPIDSFMDKLYEKFVKNGIPVVIGEFGARNKKENLQARVDFSAYYIASARARGITCCWWDNNGFYGSGENFGLFDRKTVSWKFPDIVIALTKYAE